MFTEQNKVLIQTFTNLINAKQLDTAINLLSPHFVDHTPRGGLPSGISGLRMFYALMFTAFPDGCATSLDMIAEGDKVVHRTSGEGTHQGMFLGIPPTGKRIKWFSIDIWRIADGKLVEHWVEADRLNMMQQLGLMPPPLSH